MDEKVWMTPSDEQAGRWRRVFLVFFAALAGVFLTLYWPEVLAGVQQFFAVVWWLLKAFAGWIACADHGAEILECVRSFAGPAPRS